MSELIIRELSPDEWRDYKNLRLEGLKNDPDSFGSTYAEAVKKAEDRWRAELTPEMGKKLFAEIDGELVAMAGAYFEQMDDGTVVAHLIGVYTKPEFRGQGIAARLIQALIDLLKLGGEADRLDLQVNRDAPSAIRLYEKLGFVRGEPAPDYVRADGVSFPLFVMTMPLGKR